MSVRMRLGARLSAAVVVVAVPLSTVATVSPQVVPVAQETPARTVAETFDLATIRGDYLDPLVAPPAQEIEPQTVIRGGLALGTKKERNRKIAITSERGSKVFKASSLVDHDLPSAAMRAYKRAAASIEKTDPGCRLPWTLLAGIGRVESDHGRYGGSVLGADGVPRPAIVGVALDGKGPVAAIRDTDRGAFDGDKVWDRAVGPMQFIPSTWQSAGRDGDGDGRSTPNDIDDAALAAAGYLCHGGRDLSTQAGRSAAIFSYNPSDYYVALVSAFEQGYRTGTFVIPSPDVPPGAGDGVVPVADDAADQKAARKAARKEAKAAAKAEAARVAKAEAKAAKKAAAKAARDKANATPKPTTPKPSSPPKPSTPPKPTPTPPAPKTATGPVLVVPGGWTIGGRAVAPGDLGPIGAQDYDGDGTVESVADELTGLADAGGKAAVSFTTDPFRITGFSVL